MAEPMNDQLKEKFRPNEDVQLNQEVDAALSELTDDQLYGGETPAPAVPPSAPGAPRMRHGKVIKIKGDDVFVDLGEKAQGVADVMQFEAVKVGDEFDFHIERYNEADGLYLLNLKGATLQDVSWDTLAIGQVIEGMVTGMNKGGLEMQIKGMRAFMPAGQVDIYFQKDISVYIGHKMAVEVTKFDRVKKNLIVSRRNVLEREKEEQKQKTMAEIAEGQTRKGVVRNVMDFGAFVDLGGVDGLLHVSELSHRRVRHPSDVVSVGDLVEVKIIRIDPETGKLSLSLKQSMPDPWADAATKYPVGAAVTGRVARVESFGAFIELEEGIEGLLPVSEMSWQRIRHPSDVVKDGDTIKLVVLNLDPVQRKLTFSLKQAGPDPWKTVHERYATNTVVKGTVTRVVDFGAFVELEPGLEGLIHISELAPHRVNKPSDVVKPGQETPVRILEINSEGRRISLSIRKVAEPAPAPAGASGDPAAAPAKPASPPAKKKKRPELRGGLDFNFGKNK